MNSQRGGNHQFPVVSPEADGGFLAGWTNIAAPRQVLMQTYSPNGGAIGQNDAVNNGDTPAVAWSQNLEVLERPDGDFVAVCESFGQGGALYDIYGRIFDAAGTGSDEAWIREGAEGNHLTPFVTPRADGGFAVGWTNQTAPQHVVLRPYGPSGVPSGPGQIVSFDDARPLSRSRNSEVVELSDGRLLIAWDAIEGRYTDIFARTLAGEPELTEPDFDGDGIPDAIGQDDDNDGIGDNSDPDDDNDGLSEQRELELGTNPLEADRDGDSLSDAEELELGMNPLFGDCPSWRCTTNRTWLWHIARQRSDGVPNGLSRQQELALGLNPKYRGFRCRWLSRRAGDFA